MARRTHNPIRIACRIHYVGSRITYRQLYERLINACQTREPIPGAWRILVDWSNPEVKHGYSKRGEKGVEFNEVIEDSSDNFLSVFQMMLDRQLDRIERAGIPEVKWAQWQRRKLNQERERRLAERQEALRRRQLALRKAREVQQKARQILEKMRGVQRKARQILEKMKKQRRKPRKRK